MYCFYNFFLYIITITLYEILLIILFYLKKLNFQVFFLNIYFFNNFHLEEIYFDVITDQSSLL